MVSAQATSEPAPEPRPGPTGIPLRLRPFDEIGDDEEIARKLHFDDNVEFEREPALVILGFLPRRGSVRLEPRREAFARLAAQFLDLVDSAAAGGEKARQDGLARQRPI